MSKITIILVPVATWWNMKRPTPSLAQGSLVIIEALNGTLNEYIQDLGGFENVRAGASPYRE